MTKHLVMSLLTALVLLYPPSPRADDDWRFADMVMASVNHVALTRNQVIQETRFILAEKKLDWTARLSADLLESVLDRMIAKELIYQELDRVGYQETDEAPLDTEQALTAFALHFANPQEYNVFISAIGLSRRSFVALLIRNARIERFIERRMSLMSRVTEDEVRRALNRVNGGNGAPDANQDANQDPNSRELADFTRRELEREKYTQAFARWMEDLQSRSSVHRLAHFTEPVPPLAVDYGD